jgi:hypothetical protein
MKKVLLVLAAVIAAALGLAASAQAQAGARLGFSRASALQEARAAAIQYWHRDPCGGDVTIAYSSRPPAGDNTDGVRIGLLWAWTSAATTTTDDVYTDCVVTINSLRWTPASEASGFAPFCGLLVHEYGHLMGHWDRGSDSPFSITYPVIGPRNEHVRPCVMRARLFV